MAKDRIYIESCPFIDYIKGDADPTLTENQKRNNWYIKQILTAGLNGDVELITSMLTIAEVRRAYSDKAPSE